MQTGSPASTAQAANSWVYQNIKIPSNATSADLIFWVWLQSGSGAGADKQQALLMVPGSTNLNAPYQLLWNTQQNAPTWQRIPLSLLNQKGLTLDLYFNTYNDGLGGSTAMVLKDPATGVFTVVNRPSERASGLADTPLERPVVDVLGVLVREPRTSN